MSVKGPSGDHFQDICTMVGLMTIQWAWGENALALTIGIIEENCGPIPGYAKMPLSLSSRVDCLKRACRDIPALKSLEQDARALAHGFVTLGARRHNLVHGSMRELGDGRFTSFAVSVKAGKHTIKDHSFNQRDALELNVLITKLVDDATDFMLAVHATVVA